MVPPRLVRGLLLLDVATLVVLVVCAWQVGGQDRLGDQVPWLDGAVLAVIVSGVGNAFGIATARQAITFRARTLLAPAHPGRAQT